MTGDTPCTIFLHSSTHYFEASFRAVVVHRPTVFGPADSRGPNMLVEPASCVSEQESKKGEGAAPALLYELGQQRRRSLRIRPQRLRSEHECEPIRATSNPCVPKRGCTRVETQRNDLQHTLARITQMLCAVCFSCSAPMARAERGGASVRADPLIVPNGLTQRAALGASCQIYMHILDPVASTDCSISSAWQSK